MDKRASVELPRTQAVRRALQTAQSPLAAADLLFLECWEASSAPDIVATLRAAQIRRANPRLAAEIRAELHCGRPLTDPERGALAVMA
ncbi:MAG: hypothetical protein M3Y41_13725 [Pseudomonadota bacterium]|nr:hypothetical protein [Pseudomonadota bacterium]